MRARALVGELDGTLVGTAHNYCGADDDDDYDDSLSIKLARR